MAASNTRAAAAIANAAPSAHVSRNRAGSAFGSISNTHDNAITTDGNTLVTQKVWEIFSPPPSTSLKAALFPSVLQKHRRRRKISLEVHRVVVRTHEQNNLHGGRPRADTNSGINNPDGGGRRWSRRPFLPQTTYYEECVIRVLDPQSKELDRQSRQKAKKGEATAYEYNAQDDSFDNQTEDDDASTVVPVEYWTGGVEHENIKSPPLEGWTAKYRFPIRAWTVHQVLKATVTVKIQMGKSKVTQQRDLIFDTCELAGDFVQSLEREMRLEDERTDRKLQTALQNVDGVILPSLGGGGELVFLVEIASGWDLPVGDLNNSDPYVVCLMDGQEVHRTKYISKTLDPIFTLKHDSLFLLTVDAKSLFLSEGLLCVVMDYDKLGANEKLGSILLPPKLLYDAQGERMEFKLGPPPGKTHEVSGYLAMRVRRASDYDIQFMREYKASLTRNVIPGASTLGIKEKVAIATESNGGVGNIRSYFTRQTRHVKIDGVDTKQFKIRPGPDPKHDDETTWMSKDDIQRATMTESHHWIDTGSGRLGRLFVEILGCNDLPNLDSGGRNKTDTFVSVVLEDSVVKTDIIDDCLNPRWLPWTKRAFIFHLFHGSSQLFLGVFDFDDSLNPADDHDLIGRVSIDLSNLRKDTIYILSYNIYTTARMSERQKRGTITVRLRLEIDDERKVLLSNLEPPPDMYVNVKRHKDFRVVRYTCTGKYDMTKYSMQYINSYIEELLALQHTLFHLKDAAVTLFLWRGTLPLPWLVAGRKILFPIHSLAFFLSAVLLVERPQMFPSIFFASIAWILLAAMDYRRRLPDVWSRCKTYGEFLHTLAFGSSPRGPDSIAAYDNYDEAQKFLENWQKRITDSEEAAARAFEESLRVQAEWEKEMEEIGEIDIDISTKRRVISIDPFKPLLFPVQQNLAMICRYVRHAKYIIFWEECYIAFWVVTGCLLLSFIFLFVPWLFLIKWSARFVTWTVIGPGMKLFDIYYVQHIKSPTADEIEERRRRERERRRVRTTAAASAARVKRENAAKLKAMKMYMFGKFITKVPVLKEDRYRDLPLPESTATPYRPAPLPLSELAMQEAGYRRSRVPGQHLVGDMLPRAETVGFTEAPIGQATARPRLLDRNGLGGQYSGALSTAQAYTKIGSVVVTSAVISWFIVPILSSLTDKAIQWAS